MKKTIFVSIIVMMLVVIFSACGKVAKPSSGNLSELNIIGTGNTGCQNDMADVENISSEKNSTGKIDSATSITTTEVVVKDSPIFNKVESVVSARPLRSPVNKKQEEWTFKQYKKHIGFDPIPTVIPTEFATDDIVKDTDTQTVYLEEDRTPVEGYHGCWRIYVENSSGAHMWMYISAAGVYKHDLVLPGEPAVWTVNGTAVTLAEYTSKDGSTWLTASFVLNDVGFYIETGGVSKTEFVNMVASIIE